MGNITKCLFLKGPKSIALEIAYGAGVTMSIVNFCLTQDRISIVTDTVGFLDGQPVALLGAKVAHGAVTPVACTARGLHAVGWSYLRFVETSTLDFDELLPLFAGHPPQGEEGQELCLFGFSRIAQSMRAARLMWRFGESSIEFFRPGVYVFPSHGNSASLPSTATDEQLFRIARAQWHSAAKNKSRDCVGGVCHLTSVTFRSASTRIYGLLPDYDYLAEKFGDPNAEAVAAWRYSSKEAL